ncbi:MAG: diheme cytochrome c precursor [Pirellulaceae bacterium]|nr:diheme cytochrome c precursor [Pirellulaceae bacterium]
MFEKIEPQQAANTSRAVHLALAGVVGIALVGFMVGIRQGTPIPELVPPVVNSTPADPNTIAIAATVYRDFDRRQFGPNRDWASNLSDLKQVASDLMADYSEEPVREALSEPQRLSYLAMRVQRRAFDGAPPVVPHPIDQMNTASCLACHQNGLSLGQGVVAPPMSHQLYANCTQCHAEGASTEFAHQPPSENHFHGFWLTSAGSRAFEGAPPTIPHPTWMRENCMSCHGVAGPNPIRTSHPWRASCTQCHAPSAELDQFRPSLPRE